MLRAVTYIEAMTGDRNGLGDEGESEYGEKADMRLLFGDGINGDFKAIIMMKSYQSGSLLGAWVSLMDRLSCTQLFLFLSSCFCCGFRDGRRRDVCRNPAPAKSFRLSSRDWRGTRVPPVFWYGPSDFYLSAG